MSGAVQERYRTAQDKVTRQAVGPVLAALNAIPVGVPLTPEQWARLVALMLPGVLNGRSLGRDLAAEVYATTAPTGRAPEVGVKPYDASVLSRGLEMAGVRENIVDLDKHMQGVAAGASVAARHVETAGRDYMRQATYADDDAIGYARVARGARTCAFCLMLISRGFCYKTAATAGLNDDGTMRQFHNRCDCVVVPVFDPNDWPGREQYVRAEQMWADVTGDASGKDKLLAFRRAVEQQSPAVNTGEVVAASVAPDLPVAPGDIPDADMDDALQAAIQAEDWDRFEALSEESDRRDAAREAKAAESSARSERRRQQKERERAAQFDLMAELIEQGAPEEVAYAQAYGRSLDQVQREAAIASLRSSGYQGSSFEKLARQSFTDHVYLEWQKAEDYCRGHMLNREGLARKVDDRSLFSGSYDRAVKYASEDLLTYWEENGRPTFAEWQARLLGDGAAAAEASRRGAVLR